MGKLACDLVILFSSLSALLCLLSLFQPWGATSAANLTGVTSAKYYLLSIIVEPKIEIAAAITEATHYAGNRITCPWNRDAVCYKFSTLDALMAASTW